VKAKSGILVEMNRIHLKEVEFLKLLAFLLMNQIQRNFFHIW